MNLLNMAALGSTLSVKSSLMDEADPSGWNASAAGWIRHLEEGDMAREVMLDPIMLEMAGNVEGKLVLDVGCGEGRFCRMLSKQGAYCIGLDPTVPLLYEARRVGGEFIRGNAEALPFPSESFDVVVSYLALIDIPDFRAAIREGARVLRPGGLMAVANLAPHASTSETGWARDELGRRTHFPIDRYLEEMVQHVAWKEISIVNYHRPLSAYLNAFLESGLVLRRYEEPAPSEEQIREHPSWEYDRRVPFTCAMLWEKPGHSRA